MPENQCSTCNPGVESMWQVWVRVTDNRVLFPTFSQQHHVPSLILYETPAQTTSDELMFIILTNPLCVSSSAPIPNVSSLED